MWRKLNEYESTLLKAMLDSDFPGNAVYLRQAQVADVRKFDEEHQIEFRIPKSVPSVDEPGAPMYAVVEAAFADIAGVPASFIFHADNGRLAWLEKYKADSTPLQLLEPDLGFANK